MHTHTHTHTHTCTHAPHTTSPGTGQQLPTLSVGFTQADRTVQEGAGSVTITLQKTNTNVGPLTVAITPLTIDQFSAMSLSLPADFDGVFPPGGPGPAECKFHIGRIETVSV